MIKKIIITKKRKHIFFVIAVAGLVSLLFWGWQEYRLKHPKSTSELSLAEAEKMGPKQTYRLAIQMFTPSGAPPGGFERGDIIMFAPLEKEWSDGEKASFLLIKMDLTQMQANLLSSALEKNIDEKASVDQQAQIGFQMKARRFAVDLSKLGIDQNDNKGHFIDDKIYNWKDIVIEKKLAK